MDRNKKVSIIFSFRNEESTILELIKRSVDTLKNLTNYSYEIIFVDDASSDRSQEILSNELKANNSLKYIRMKNRFGQIECLIAGLEKVEGDCVIFLDSDLQDPPELFPTLIKEWENGARIVHTMRKSRAGESFIKMLATKFAYRLINLFSYISIPVDVGDYKLLDRAVVSELLKFSEEAPYLRAIIPWIDHRQAIVKYDRDARYSGSTKFPLLGLNPIETFFIGFTSYSVAPLYLGFIISIICFLAMPLFWHNSLILFLFGILFFIVGILGMYIARVHRQSRGRPLYIIDQELGFNNA